MIIFYMMELMNSAKLGKLPGSTNLRNKSMETGHTREDLAQEKVSR
jgi:hypothetical protein